MYLLYMDESGRHDAENFVLCGVAVFERQVYWSAKELDDLQERHLPGSTEPVEFHASTIRAGKAPFDWLSVEERHRLLDDLYGTIRERPLNIFACVLNRGAFRSYLDRQEAASGARGTDFTFEDHVYLFAYESLVNRFDRFLERASRQGEPPEEHRGLLLLAHSEMKERLESISRRFHATGTRWGEVRRLGELMPWFTPAKNSRLLQIADLCANATFGYYEKALGRQFNSIYPRFDRSEGQLHGLFHFSPRPAECPCPGCVTRRGQETQSRLTREDATTSQLDEFEGG